MWQGVGEDAEERLSTILLTQPLQCMLVYEVGAVLLSVVVVLAVHGMLYVLLQHFTYDAGIPA